MSIRADFEQLSIRSGDLNLSATFYLPEGSTGPLPAVVVCHGLGSRKENHADFARVLIAHGMAALTFDFRGHGESEGALDENVTSDVPAVVEYLTSRPEVDAGRIGVRGSSLGGQLAIHGAAADRRVGAVVAVCPAHEFLLQGKDGDPEFETRVDELASQIRLSRGGFLRHLREHDVMTSAPGIAPRPFLIVHCKGDELVPFHLSERLMGVAGEPKELWLLEGGSHTSAQHDPDLQRRTAEWMAARLDGQRLDGHGQDGPS